MMFTTTTVKTFNIFKRFKTILVYYYFYKLKTKKLYNF